MSSTSSITEEMQRPAFALHLLNLLRQQQHQLPQEDSEEHENDVTSTISITVDNCYGHNRSHRMMLQDQQLNASSIRSARSVGELRWQTCHASPSQSFLEWNISVPRRKSSSCHLRIPERNVKVSHSHPPRAPMRRQHSPPVIRPLSDADISGSDHVRMSSCSSFGIPNCKLLLQSSGDHPTSLVSMTSTVSTSSVTNNDPSLLSPLSPLSSRQHQPLRLPVRRNSLSSVEQPQTTADLIAQVLEDMDIKDEDEDALNNKTYESNDDDSLWSDCSSINSCEDGYESNVTLDSNYDEEDDDDDDDSFWASDDAESVFKSSSCSNHRSIGTDSSSHHRNHNHHMLRSSLSSYIDQHQHHQQQHSQRSTSSTEESYLSYTTSSCCDENSKNNNKSSFAAHHSSPHNTATTTP